MQALVAPDGQCMHYGGTINGRYHDFVLYEQGRLASEMLTMVVQADGSGAPTRPAILADGSYAGIAATCPEAITPRRRRPHPPLTDEDREFNRRLSHDRAIVERYLGRLKGHWTILKRPLRIDRVDIDGLMRILVCLTNPKIQNQPMFEDEPMFRPDPEYEGASRKRPNKRITHGPPKDRGHHNGRERGLVVLGHPRGIRPL